MDLNDELSQNERDALRARVTQGARRAEHARARRGRTIAGTAAVALVAAVISGVTFAALRADDGVATPVDTPVPTSTPAPSASTPEPSPTEAPAPAETQTQTPQPSVRTVAFDGSCENVLTEPQVQTLLGPGARIESVPAPNGHAEMTAGGIECRWIPDPAASALITSLDVIVFPVGVVPAGFVEDQAAVACGNDYDAVVCRLGRATPEVWISARVAGGGLPDEAPPTDVLAAAIDTVESNGAAFAPPEPAVADDSWWRLTSCEELGARIGIADDLGTGFRTGRWEGVVTAEERLREAIGVEQRCQWFTPEGAVFDDLSMVIQPGGAWMWDEVAGPGEPLAVEGAQAAVVESADGFARVRATDGVNTVHAFADEVDEAVDLVERALSFLSQ